MLNSKVTLETDPDISEKLMVYFELVALAVCFGVSDIFAVGDAQPVKNAQVTITHIKIDVINILTVTSLL